MDPEARTGAHRTGQENLAALKLPRTIGLENRCPLENMQQVSKQVSRQDDVDDDYFVC